MVQKPNFTFKLRKPQDSNYEPSEWEFTRYHGQNCQGFSPLIAERSRIITNLNTVLKNS
jgi:hypothetical protein